MKELICTVGLPRSGKTTWARESGYPIVNPDSIRYALHGQRFIGNAEPFIWAIAKVMVDSLFKAGHDIVVLDATNTTTTRREEWITEGKYRDFVVSFKVIGTSQGVCIGRAKLEKDDYIIPIIEKMALQWDYPDVYVR